MDFSDYRLEHEGIVVCEPCLSYVFFSNVQLSTEEPPNLLDPYRNFLKKFSSRVTYARTDGDQIHPKKITEQDLALPEKWLADPKKRARKDLMLELHAGSTRDEWRAPSLDLAQLKDEPQRTYCIVNIPLSDYERWELGGVIDYLEHSLIDFPLASGYVGYSFFWNSSWPKAEDIVKPYFHRWLLRHPGLLSTTPSSLALPASVGLTELGWITLLGADLCDRLGGVDGLRRVFAHLPDVTVSRLTNGVSIRIGDKPRLGDLAAGDELHTYKAVGAALASLRDRELLHRRVVVDGLFEKHSRSIQSRWLDRFFSQ